MDTDSQEKKKKKDEKISGHRSLCDIEKMRFIKNWLLRRRIEQAKRLLTKIDMTMKALNMPRWKRKQVWRGFIKSEGDRKNIIKILNGAKP